MNGTYVDDQKIQQATLMPGKVIQIGALMLKIEFSDAPEPAPVRAVPKKKENVQATQRMEIFPPVSKPAKKSWWQKLFG